MNEDKNETKILIFAMIFLICFITVVSYIGIKKNNSRFIEKINLQNCIKNNDILMKANKHTVDIITDNIFEADYLIRNNTQLLIKKEDICN